MFEGQKQAEKVSLAPPVMVWHPVGNEQKEIATGIENEARDFMQTYGTDGAADSDDLKKATIEENFPAIRKLIGKITQHILENERALHHENSRIANIDMRLETADTYRETTVQTGFDFHVDNLRHDDPEASFYIFAYGLGTIGMSGTVDVDMHTRRIAAPMRVKQHITPQQLVEDFAAGEQTDFDEVNVASALPLALYRLTANTVHAIPSRESYDRYFNAHPEGIRFFIRVSVNSEEPETNK